MPSSREVLRLGQSAAYLALSRSTICALVERGELDCELGSPDLRIRRAELDDWVVGRGGGPDAPASTPSS